MAIPHSYNEVMQVSVADAKNKLPELIKIAEGGEPVTICRRGVPVVDLVRTENSGSQKPRFGTLRGRIKINDPNWWHPMSQDEVDAMLGTPDSRA
jgi:prevent-host-death family protein